MRLGYTAKDEIIIAHAALGGLLGELTHQTIIISSGIC